MRTSNYVPVPSIEMRRIPAEPQFSPEQRQAAQAAAETATDLGHGAHRFVKALRTSYASDSVVVDLQKALAAFRMRDAAPSCFELPYGLLLAERGFVSADETNPVSSHGRLHWQAVDAVALGAKMGGNYAEAVEKLNHGLGELILKNLDENKKGLGANVRRRDALAWSFFDDVDNCMPAWIFCCPCMLGRAIGNYSLNACWGKSFDDPR